MDPALTRELLDPLGALLTDSERLAASLDACPHASAEARTLIRAIKHQAQRLHMHREACLTPSSPEPHSLTATSGLPVIGHSPVMQRVLQLVRQVAASQATVLLTGESGTGKEVVAEAIHQASARRAHALVKVNCGALPETLLEAELFGSERGAFTGAVGRRDGRFTVAHRGTLFLDEVGSLSPVVQVKLLRVLQDGAFEPLGSNRTIRSDARIIAATNSDLTAQVANGSFRDDLFYRLNVVTIVLPPLRDRIEDVPLLATHFMHLHATRNRKHIDRISRAAMARLVRHPWPGNVRELEHAIEHAVVMAPRETIDVDHLPLGLSTDRGSERATSEPMAHALTLPTGLRLDEVEQLLIHDALRRSGGNKQQAARLLGINVRTIHRRLRPEDAGPASCC